ncbi:uncharacterized protein EKO05_0006860 [Ascochyta rabiei]|uniref:Uncharacterized protein n=1 Tax=Didymella rabiei TaxID=5454 RepID=A0A162Z189_DIDRA|nr:uncharacterized protein EKO05_0006860 [Ascochyta rabiei]KZM20344.1 hypothetical protein ST47_g8564 [Ascochyta rabiei]UPX16462.1 hypothetical protein EKO05_0006860 [Ascochyta rabiei]
MTTAGPSPLLAMSLPHSSATEQHRKKRQFQPSITSYFHTAQDYSDDDDNDDDYHADGHHHHHQRGGPRLRHIPKPTPRHPTLAPQLPDHVQSSLLSVGMRVRKSVPEGYKTPKTALPALQTTNTANYSQTPLRKPRSAFSAPALEPMRIPVDTLASTLQHQRELLPFCGLNKIGGYAEQPTTNPHLFSGVTNSFPLPAQAFSQPFSSQDSGYGTDMARAKLGKRGWSDEDDNTCETPSLSLGASNFLFSIPTKVTGEEDVPVSPLSESPPPPSLPSTRQYAQPKSRRQGRPMPGHVHADVDVDMDYESHGMHEGRLAAGHASDFEEADFLDGHEVAMGGV